jgi:hypothetical protein
MAAYTHGREANMKVHRHVSTALAAALGCFIPVSALATPIGFESLREGSLAGDTTDITKIDAKGLPTAATTWMTNPFFAAEHELLHAIGFAASVKRFSDRLQTDPDGSRPFKDGSGKVIAVLTPKEEGTHIDASKKVGGKDQSSVMEPDPGGKEAGEFERLILDAAYGWTEGGGLSIQIVFTGRFADEEKAKDERAHIQKIVAKIEALFGRKEGVKPHVFKWDAQGYPVRKVAEPSSVALLGAGLAGLAWRARRKRSGREDHAPAG